MVKCTKLHKVLCVSSSPPVARSERTARHAGRFTVPRLVVWHSFHISSLTRSCIFTYIPFSYHSFNRQMSAVILFSNGAWTPRTRWRARCAYREGFWVIHRHFPASSHCQGLIFSPQEGRSSSGFLLGQIDVSLLPLL